MTQSEWHASPALLARFVADPGAMDDMTASSIEAHLIACAGCRQQVAAEADPTAAAKSWDAIADRIDRPKVRLLERSLRRFGLGSGFARLLAATPALQAAGLASIAVVAIGAAILSRTADATGPFLVLAPLAPLAAVAASFAPAADPAGEASAATPLHGAGLVVRRALAVLVVSFGLLVASSLALPDLDAGAVRWVLPALALALGALALGTWVRVEVAVAMLGAGWLVAVYAAWWLAGFDAPVVDVATFAAAGQLAALTLAVVAAAAAAVRRDHFATLEAFR